MRTTTTLERVHLIQAKRLLGRILGPGFPFYNNLLLYEFHKELMVIVILPTSRASLFWDLIQRLIPTFDLRTLCFVHTTKGILCDLPRPSTAFSRTYVHVGTIEHSERPALEKRGARTEARTTSAQSIFLQTD